MSALERTELRIVSASAIVPSVAPSGYPRSWYLLCRTADVRPGQVIARELLGHPLVLFRTQSGSVHALDAHCAHMGTHLRSGTVMGDCLRCPLHHWSFEGNGQCRGGKPGVGQRAWPVAERFGAIFVFHGDVPLFEPPAFEGVQEKQLCTRVGRSVSIECPWMGISSNAFDMRHLGVVHARALREPPAARALDRYRLQLRYVSRVTGTGISDRVMKWLSGDHIRVLITSWGGTVLTVESQAGRHKSMLLLSMMPTSVREAGHGVEGGVTITPVFVRKRKGLAALDAIGIRMAAWLFTRFLERDVAMMRGMRFKAPETKLPLEEPLREYLRFVDALPRGNGGFGGEMENACARD